MRCPDCTYDTNEELKSSVERPFRFCETCNGLGFLCDFCKRPLSECYCDEEDLRSEEHPRE